MSKEDIKKISQILAVSENKQNQRSQPERELIFIDENRNKTGEERLLATNLERLKKTGIVKLFEEIKEEGLNGKSFDIHYHRENTVIKLIWDYYYNNEIGSIDATSEWKELSGYIDNQDRLHLHKRIWSDYGNEYFGPYTLVENNLVELVGRKLGEDKDTQTQPQPENRCFLDILFGN